MRNVIRTIESMHRSCPEADWKVFRKVREVALERFCQRILDEVDRVHQGDGRTYHARYLDVCRLLAKRNKEMSLAFDDPRRSQMFPQLAAIVALDLVRPEELAQFTPATKETIKCLSKFRSG
jgi:hypothetical protein